MRKRNITLLASLLTLLTFSSCKTTKYDLAYFEDIQNSTAGTLTTLPHTNVIEPENELIINVTSEVPQATAEFNMPYTNPALTGTTDMTGSPKLRTYVVDPAGDIDFPKLGKIHVAGMTITQIKDELTQRISKFVKDPMVTVTLRGYGVTVLGEVATPQTVFTAAERFSVLDALASCGDLTEYAKRDNILVMRRMPDNKIEYGRLNLHSTDITGSPYFWLKNNDVIIVEPNKIKQENAKISQHTTYRMSVISTIVSISSIIASLIIALTVK